MDYKTLSIKKYRPEIDGLRALAVVAVIVNHFNKDLLPSGYLGVDIFFVISGYVITLSLANRNETNFREFTTSFFVRRIKRIIPALIPFTIISSLLICFFNPYPEESIKTGLASLFGFSNIYLFFLKTDYFANTTLFNVFTHTWSLDVEEQFYLIFPFVIWFTGFANKRKKGNRNILISIIISITLSILIYYQTYQFNQSAAYFLLPMRFWEIATGCLTFLIFENRNFIKIFLKLNTSLIFIIIVFLFTLPTSSSLIATTLAVIFTSLLIICINKQDYFYLFLTNSKILHLGKISYSLYLWHWTILCISRWTIGIHIWSIPFQIILIYVCAISSYKWIELPFRTNELKLHKWDILLRGILSIIFSAGLLLTLFFPLKGYFYLGNKELDAQKPFLNTVLIDEKYCNVYNPKKDYSPNKIFSKCFVNDIQNQQTLFLMGDSFSQSFWQGAEFIAEKTNSNFFTFNTPGHPFPPIKTFNSNRNKILKVVEKELLKKVKDGDIIFIENDHLRISDIEFDLWLNSLENFSLKLKNKYVSIIITTPTPKFNYGTENKCREHSPQWFNKYSRIECKFEIPYNSKKLDYLKKRKIKLDKVAEKNNNIYLFDKTKVMCSNEKCNYTLNDKSLYYDETHISNYSAKKVLAPRILNFLNKKEIIKTVSAE